MKSRESEMLSPIEYARAKGFSLNWVYTLLWMGALAATKVNGKWQIKADAVPARQSFAMIRKQSL